jgi:hypothetical protein
VPQVPHPTAVYVAIQSMEEPCGGIDPRVEGRHSTSNAPHSEPQGAMVLLWEVSGRDPAFDRHAQARSSKLSTWLISQAHDLWKARNEELHRPTAPDNSQIARAALELQERVQELYEQKGDQDRDLLRYH